MITNLSELLAVASIEATTLIKKSVQWKQPGKDGKEIEYSADVFIISDISFSAQERIYLGDSSTIDAGRMSRAISERLRFGEDGSEKMSHEQAANLHPSFGFALTKLLFDYQTEKEKAAETAAGSSAKGSSRKTKSGTN